MTITIPTWALWLLGIAGGLAALALMALGVMFLVMIWNWKGPY